MTPEQGAFRALADPNRRAILMMLSNSDMTIADIADRFEFTRAATKKHLTILEEGNLISVHTQGRERINHLEPMALKRAADWISYFDRFWDDKLAKLQSAVDGTESRSND